MINKLLLKLFMANLDDILAMAIHGLIDTYKRNRDKMMAVLVSGVQKSPLKETATPEEMNEVVDAIEDLLEEISGTPAFERVMKAFESMFKK